MPYPKMLTNNDFIKIKYGGLDINLGWTLKNRVKEEWNKHKIFWKYILGGNQ